MNKVFLLGRMGKDPELKTTQSGKTLCRFSLATTEKWKDSSGTAVEKVTWHNCVAWGKTAEIVARFGSKGAMTAIVGKIESSTSEDSETGIKKTYYSINVEEYTNLTWNGNGKSQDKPSPSGFYDQRKEVKKDADPFEDGSGEDEEDDVPF